MKRLVLLSYLIAGCHCPGQGPTDAYIWLNNYDANQPILYSDGRTTQLAPFLTRVQVLARPVGSQAAFTILENVGFHISTFLTGSGPDAGLFDAGYGIVPGVKQEDPAEFIIRAWRGDATWESALTNASAFVGQTPIFTNRTGDYVDLPLPAQLTNFTSFTIYPFPDACRLVPFVGLKPLCINATANGQTLAFTWADIGTNYVYTLEFKPSLTATNWVLVPAPLGPRTRISSSCPIRQRSRAFIG
jgi:hypothetical protein